MPKMEPAYWKPWENEIHFIDKNLWILVAELERQDMPRQPVRSSEDVTKGIKGSDGRATACVTFPWCLEHTNRHASPMCAHFFAWFSGQLKPQTAPEEVLDFYLQHWEVLQGIHPTDISCDHIDTNGTERAALVHFSVLLCAVDTWGQAGSPQPLQQQCQPWASGQLWLQSLQAAHRAQAVNCFSVWLLQGVIHRFHFLLLHQHQSCSLNITHHTLF